MFEHRLTIDDRARRVALNGSPVDLTTSEFEILALLARQPGSAVPIRALLTVVWGSPWEGDRAALQVHISRLRTKLGESSRHPRFIHTVRGYGYRFDPGIPEVDGVHGSPSFIGPTVPVVLVYDRTLTLTAILPRATFLGMSPEQILGTKFTPTGLSVSAQMQVIDVARAAGLPGFDSIVPLQHADGGTRMRRVATVLSFSTRGTFEGLQGTLYLEPEDLG